METGKLLAVVQSGGEFVTNKDGTISYSGGEAHALDIGRDMPLKDLQSELSSMFYLRGDSYTIKYFLPNNKRTPITISSDKDVQRMVDFHGNSPTVDIYVLKNSRKEPKESRKTKTRRTRGYVADSDTATDNTLSMYDHSNFELAEETKQLKVCNDWDNLITGVGQTFNSTKDLRDALHKYAIANRFEYRFVKNESQRLTAECTAENCPWRIHASRTPGNQDFVIKKFVEIHHCDRRAVKDRSRLANQKWVASVIKEKLRESPNYSPKDIANDLHREYGLNLNYSQAWRGKFFAKQELCNSHEEACSQLPWLCERILETNPGSIATLEKLEDSKFHLFIAFHASLSGFEQGCRPLLFLEGFPLKASKLWKVLVASALDGENSIFPVAFSVVDEVNQENWHWFLVQLKSTLSNSRTITFISKMMNGLNEEVSEVFEDSYHGYCTRHLEEEFREQLVEDDEESLVLELRKCISACKVEEFNECIETIKSKSKELADWVASSKPILWSDAYFKGLRYGSYSSNASSIFNNWVTSRYEPSVVQIVDMIRCKMMEMIYTRRENSNTWVDVLTPSMNQKVQEDMAKSRNMDVVRSNGNVFEVNYEDIIYVVNIETWECTCRKWQVMGMPCLHALAVIEKIQGWIADFCSKYFTAEYYRVVYSSSIIPIPDAAKPKCISPINFNEMTPTPRRSTRQRGRPKQKLDDPRLTVKRSLRCSKCQGVGHNKQTCKATLQI